MDAPTTAALNWGEIAQRVKGQQGYTAMMRWGKVAHGLTKTEDVVRMQHELMKVRAQWPNTTGAAGKRGIINWRPDMEAMGATEYPSNENSDPTQPGVFAMYDSLYNMRRERSWMKRISRTKWDGTHNWQIQVFRTHRVRASVAAHNMEHPRLTSFVETRQGTSTEAGIAIDIPEDIARGTQFQMEQRLIELLQSAAVEMDYTESHFVIRSFLGGGLLRMQITMQTTTARCFAFPRRHFTTCMKTNGRRNTIAQGGRATTQTWNWAARRTPLLSPTT